MIIKRISIHWPFSNSAQDPTSRMKENQYCSLYRVHTIIGRSWREYHFCRDKTILSRVCRDKTRLLSRQKFACRDKTFVVTNIFCRDKIMFVSTNVLCVLRQIFCHDKYTFVATKVMFCKYKGKLAATKLLLRQNYVCRDK